MRSSLIIIICIVVAVALLELVIFLLVDIRTGKKKARKYIQIMDEKYESEGVTGFLNEAVSALPKKCIERAKIEEALGYLECSILKDYKTAFQIIEKGFPQKNIKEHHAQILSIEQEKANALLLLPGPKNL